MRAYQGDKFKSLVFLSGDTILKNQDYYFQVEFLDINGDGYKDIRAFVFSSTPNACENYFFDKEKKTFRYIENCDLDIQLIKGTKYFYSYDAIGCGDSYWESHLLKIENWREKDIGSIDARGCGGKDNGISIYKLHGDTSRLIKRISIRTLEKYKNNKFGFIKDYWTRNWVNFVN